jgi:hypothetical protein
MAYKRRRGIERMFAAAFPAKIMVNGGGYGEAAIFHIFIT